MKPNQLAAIKKLEAALLSVKRAGLVLVGSDEMLLIAVKDDSFYNASAREAHETMRQSFDVTRGLAFAVKHYGSYRGSGRT